MGEHRVKTRRERFLTVGVRRTNEAIDRITRLGRCFNRSCYEYSDEEARQMLASVQEAVDYLNEEYERVSRNRPVFRLDN